MYVLRSPPLTKPENEKYMKTNNADQEEITEHNNNKSKTNHLAVTSTPPSKT